jgi:hypothetical protein
MFHPVVVKLLSVNERQQAFEEIISWQKYRGEITYTAKVREVGHVVLCPQIEGTTLFAVFHGAEGKAEGWYTLLTGGGEIVPCYNHYNFISQYDVFDDINGDGIIERVYGSRLSPLHFSEVQYEGVVVLPMTFPQKPSLIVVYNIEKNVERWRWQLRKYLNNPDIIEIQKKTSTYMETMASYKWCPFSNTYNGQEGGIDKDFWRIDLEQDRDCHKEILNKLIRLRANIQ